MMSIIRIEGKHETWQAISYIVSVLRRLKVLQHFREEPTSHNMHLVSFYFIFNMLQVTWCDPDNIGRIHESFKRTRQRKRRIQLGNEILGEPNFDDSARKNKELINFSAGEQRRRRKSMA